MAIRRGFASRIESIEYFYATEADAANAKTLGLGAGELDANGERRDYVAYLSQGDNESGAGELLVFERPAPATDSPIPDLSSLSPLAGLVTGQKASGGLMRDLCAGKNPTTHEVALAGRKYKGKLHKPGGFDLQIGTPKAVSLATIFDRDRAAGIRAAERKGYVEAMAWAWERGFFAIRVTRDGKTVYEPARRMAMAVYRHSTSRAEDPHDHHHGAVMAMAERQNGSLGTVSNYLLKLYGGAVIGYKKCTEAGALKELGLAVERDPRNPRDYRLAGVDPRLVELFSKRRAMIEAAAERAGIDTTVERAMAQQIAFDTRAAKGFTEAAALEARWERELASAGYTRESFVFALDHAAREQAAKRPQETPQRRGARLETIVMDALTELQRDSAAFTRATLYRVAFEALQCEVDDGAEAARIVETLERNDRLVLLADRSGEPVYTTRDMIEIERDTLVIAWRGRGQGPKISPERIAAALSRVDAELKAKHGPNAGIRNEQRRAVLHALSGDQFTATQGYAGTGKSFITALQREIVEADGYKVVGTAPSWKATDVLKTDSGLRAENCIVLAKLLHDFRAGKLVFDARSYIIVDEAGMVSAHDMHALMQIARDTGANVRLQGDKGQFRAVDAGQPFAALQRLLGAAELRDILRQESDWQRAASVALDDANNSANGTDASTKIRQALQAYDDADRIVWADDNEAAFAVAVDQMMRWRTKYPDASTAIITEWNVNARAASALLRKRLKEASQIDAEDVELPVITRGSADNTRASILAFAAGDEIIFGENVVLRERTLRNCDLARIVSISASDAVNPKIRFRMGDGQEIEACYAALVGRREDGEIAAPRFQHSYVVTAHSSQGATYARTIELSLEGHGREATLVATTRHRIDHVKIVATERLADAIASKEPSTMTLIRGGAIAKAAEYDDQREERAQLDAIETAYFTECSQHDDFGSVSDYFDDIYDFAGVAKPAAPRPAGVPAAMPSSLLRRRMAVIAQATRARLLCGESERTPAFAPMLRAGRGHLASTLETEEDARGFENPDRVSRRRLLAQWENLKRIGDQTHRWLVERCGVPYEIVARFSANVRSELSGLRTSFGAAFALRDDRLRLTDICRRGPDGAIRFALKGAHGLFQAGDLGAPAQAYITATAVDTLSLFTHDGAPQRAALLATDGSLHPNAHEIIARRARQWPDTEWHVGQSNDERLYPRADGDCDAILQAIREGNPDARVSVHDPGADYDSWNSRLRGQEFSKAAIAARLAAERAAQGQAIARREAETEARAEVVTAARAAPRLR